MVCTVWRLWRVTRFPDSVEVFTLHGIAVYSHTWGAEEDVLLDLAHML